MATQTPNFSFDKPTEGGDGNVWGGYLNDNWDSVDTELQATNDALTALAARVTAAENDIVAQQIPIGGVVGTADDVNPGTSMGYGTWVRFGEDRAIVGAGGARSGEELFGSDTHTLTQAEMPAHNHGVNDPGHFHDLNEQPWTNKGDANKGFVNQGFQVDFGSRRTNTKTTGISIQTSGSGNSHTSVQASIGMYLWKRTV